MMVNSKNDELQNFKSVVSNRAKNKAKCHKGNWVRNCNGRYQSSRKVIYFIGSRYIILEIYLETVYHKWRMFLLKNKFIRKINILRQILWKVLIFQSFFPSKIVENSINVSFAFLSDAFKMKFLLMKLSNIIHFFLYNGNDF